MQFPDWLRKSFFDELAAEERRPDGTWHKRSKRLANEAFDLYVYVWVLLIHNKADRINWESPPPWAELPDNNSEILQPGEKVVSTHQSDQETALALAMWR